jgi:hypothetical protein
MPIACLTLFCRVCIYNPCFSRLNRFIHPTPIYAQGSAPAPNTGASTRGPARLLGPWNSQHAIRPRHWRGPCGGDISGSVTWAEPRFPGSDQSNGLGSLASIRTEGGRIEGFPRLAEPSLPPTRADPLEPAKQQTATGGRLRGGASRPCLVRRAAHRPRVFSFFLGLLLSVWCDPVRRGRA